MNAVWLNDELMVSPETVAGLHLRWTNGDYENWFRKCRWYVEVIWTSGARQAVWWGQLFDEKWERGDPPEGLAPARAELRVAAQAEMERLSALLWPPEPERAWVVNRMPDIRIYDPELYGLAVCPYLDTGRSEARCNLAVGHPGDHRFGPTFSEAHPDAPCGSMSNSGYRCELRYGHELPHFGHSTPDVETTWDRSDHV